MDINLLKFKTSSEWINFTKYYSRSNIMKEIGLFRYEDANTNYLYSVLNPNNIYNLGLYPMRLFIELLATKNSQVFGDFNPFAEHRLEIIHIKKQYKLSANCRPDLFVQFKFDNSDYVLCLEAKLLSTEHDNQCSAYKAVMDTNYPASTKKLYVYLALDNSSSISAEYTRVTYQELIDYLYTPCSLKVDNPYNLEEYIKSFDSLYDIDSMDKSLIPITPTSKELTKALFKKYENIIPSLLKNEAFTNSSMGRILIYNLLKLSNTLELDSEITTLLNKVVSIHKCSFDKTPLSNSDCLCSVFKDIIKTHNITSYEQLTDLGLVDIVNGWPTLIPDNVIKNHPKADYYTLGKDKQSPILIGTQKYWYCNNNNVDDMRRFRDKVIEVYPEYENRFLIIE